PSSLDGTYARKDFHSYTGMEPQLFKEIILKNFDFIEDYMLKTIIHAQTIQKRLNDKKLQIQECIVQEVKALDVISATNSRQSKKELHGTMFLNVDQLEKQLDKEEFQEIGSIASFKVLETQFQMFFKSRMYLDDEFVIQTTEGKVDTGKEVDASLVNTKSIGTESKEQHTSSKSGNDAHADDADIRPIYDEEPMVEERLTRMLNNVMTHVLCLLN
ncbi:hypothetical protein Tco_0074772, partial [Tanacetum coccineum]